jgi:hypothetical protein
MRSVLVLLLLSSAAAPQSGFDPARLEAARANLARKGTRALYITLHGKPILEWYADGVTAAARQGEASLSKALVGGTSLLIAIGDGRLRPYDRAARFIPAWRDDPMKSRIEIRHLATHTSGVEDAEEDDIPHDALPGWKGAFWRRDPDPFSIALRDPRMLFAPGTSNAYSNPGMAALSYAITASLNDAPQKDVRSLLRERLMLPLGIADDEWSIGYGRAYRVDGLDLWANWGGSNFSPRAAARIFEMMMHGGEWQGRQVVPRSFVEQALRYAGLPIPDRNREPYAPGSGLAWYTNFDGCWPEVPRDAFAGAGAQHQIALAVPSLDLVVVRNGRELAHGEPFWTPVYRELFEPVMAAFRYPARKPAPPYPPSPAIGRVEFAPAGTIVRRALDSDNWPITWGDDGSLYTVYGDGHGFEPFTPEKLSLGFARIEGGPGDFRGVNIRSATGERTGSGRGGAKASGLLMVDGVLYMWVRNTGNAQLAWSEDRARTWTYGFKLEQGFGSPSFLNFGANYRGARDGYVYAYSQAGGSAYDVDDEIVLARAPKGRLRDRAAWRFWDGHGGWTADLAARAPVFRYPGHCQRVDAAYNPGLKRYLLAVGYGHNGGWGIFDAPEPWGPWTTAFHTEYWGQGETHGYRMPSKWISRDGRSMVLVFSGLIYNGVVNDAFCVRRMSLHPPGEAAR